MTSPFSPRGQPAFAFRLAIRAAVALAALMRLERALSALLALPPSRPQSTNSSRTAFGIFFMPGIYDLRPISLPGKVLFDIIRGLGILCLSPERSQP